MIEVGYGVLLRKSHGATYEQDSYFLNDRLLILEWPETWRMTHITSLQEGRYQ